jgi:hypothetical protein
MDIDKTNFFAQQYRTLDTEELVAMAGRADGLVDEAREALRAVLSERRMSGVRVKVAEEASPAPDLQDRAQQAKLSTALWNGPQAKQVHALAAAQGLVMAGGFNGVIPLGGVGVAMLAGLMTLAGFFVGTKLTRAICARADLDIAEKTRRLRNLGIALWPSLLLSVALGVVLAKALRAA